MLKQFRADLHIHTCLSPCGDLKMTPQKIVQSALKRKLDIIAICDHNTAENLPAIINIARGKNISVIPGMEICTKEEIHILAFFETIKPAFAIQSFVYDNLPGKNDPDVFGLQVIGNEQDEVIGFSDRLLIGAVDVSIEEMVDRIHRVGGLAIASHIDRESYSVIGQLGFIPEALKFDALEISPHSSIAEASIRFGEYQSYPFIQNSDAHFIDDIGKGFIDFMIAEPTFSEIVKAFRKEDRRRVIE